MKRNTRNCRGVTVLEIMIVVVMVSILAVIAIPNFQELLEKNRTSTLINEFVASVSYARSEAVKRGQQVTLCKSPNGAQCVTAGNWGQGWMVWVDADDDGTIDGGEVLQVREGFDGGVTLIGNAGIANTIDFLGTGFVVASGNATLCNGSDGVELELVNTGRVRTEKVICP